MLLVILWLGILTQYLKDIFNFLLLNNYVFHFMNGTKVILLNFRMCEAEFKIIYKKILPQMLGSKNQLRIEYPSIYFAKVRNANVTCKYMIIRS